MGFFSSFWQWLQAQLTTYVGNNTAAVAAIIEPAVIAMATVYVMIWGYSQMTGRLAEPMVDGLIRLVRLTVIVGVGLRLWLYNSVIVDTFYSAPSQLAARLLGVTDPISTLDAIWNAGGTVAQTLWQQGTIYSSDFGFYIAGLMVWLVMGALCIYAMFLMALANIAVCLLLAIGPIFIVMLLFEATRRLFDSWIAQLINYGLITVLTVMIGALLLQLVKSYAQQTLAQGAALTTMDAFDMLLAAVLVFLLLRQVMAIASGLASGAALSTLGVVGSTLMYGRRALATGAGAVIGLSRGRP